MTEASANLALMDAMMDAMIEAGFDSVFVGIETPNPEALLKTKKAQNTSKTQENFLYHALFEKFSNTACRFRAGSSWVWIAMTRACSMPRSSSSRRPAFLWPPSIC